MTIYKVRDKLSGLWVQRGSWRVYLSKNGTVWKQKSHLRASINNKLFQKLEGKVELEIVKFELVEKQQTNLLDW